MFIGDYDMFPVKIEVILDFKTDPIDRGIEEWTESLEDGERD